MLLSLAMQIFGIIALTRNEFKITNNRKVKGSICRPLGISLIIGTSFIAFPYYGPLIQLAILTVTIIIGLIKSEAIDSISIKTHWNETEN